MKYKRSSDVAEAFTEALSTHRAVVAVAVAGTGIAVIGKVGLPGPPRVRACTDERRRCKVRVDVGTGAGLGLGTASGDVIHELNAKGVSGGLVGLVAEAIAEVEPKTNRAAVAGAI